MIGQSEMIESLPDMNRNEMLLYRQTKSVRKRYNSNL